VDCAHQNLGPTYRCLKESLQPDGSFKVNIADGSLEDAEYYGTSFRRAWDSSIPARDFGPIATFRMLPRSRAESFPLSGRMKAPDPLATTIAVRSRHSAFVEADWLDRVQNLYSVPGESRCRIAYWSRAASASTVDKHPNQNSSASGPNCDPLRIDG
jgi:hypothetical protein